MWESDICIFLRDRSLPETALLYKYEFTTGQAQHMLMIHSLSDTYTNTCLSVFMYACMYVCMHVDVHMHRHKHIYIHYNVLTYVCACVCMYIQI